MRKILLFLLLLPALSWATLATPTAVSSTTVATNTVTVNSTAHGLSVGQGACIAGSSASDNNTCFRVVTATANSYTWTKLASQTVTACSSSCGNTRPGILIELDRVTPLAGPFSQFVTICVWNYTATGVAKPGATSQCTSATAEENAGIANGGVVETARTFEFPAIDDVTKIFNIALDFQTSTKNAMDGLSSTVAQPGSYVGRKCDTVGCN